MRRWARTTLQDKFGSQFGMDARKSMAEGFKQDYGQLSPTARGGIEGAMKGLAMGGPLGNARGRGVRGLGGYAMPNGIMGMLGSIANSRPAPKP
jgi:hypothetical protein